jgi:ClpP class serine protease
MNGIYDNMLANIAADREITPQATRAAIESTPFTAQRARELGFIDQVGRPEEAERAALARGENYEMVDFIRLSRADSHEWPGDRGGARRRRDRLRPSKAMTSSATSRR